jgi:hypothetical protein
MLVTSGDQVTIKREVALLLDLPVPVLLAQLFLEHLLYLYFPGVKVLPNEYGESCVSNELSSKNLNCIVTMFRTYNAV